MSVDHDDPSTMVELPVIFFVSAVEREPSAAKVDPDADQLLDAALAGAASRLRAERWTFEPRTDGVPIIADFEDSTAHVALALGQEALDVVAIDWGPRSKPKPSLIGAVERQGRNR